MQAESTARVAMLRDSIRRWAAMLAAAVDRRDYAAACGYSQRLVKMTAELREIDR
jgi:hypothetical protein